MKKTTKTDKPRLKVNHATPARETKSARLEKEVGKLIEANRKSVARAVQAEIRYESVRGALEELVHQADKGGDLKAALERARRALKAKP